MHIESPDSRAACAVARPPHQRSAKRDLVALRTVRRLLLSGTHCALHTGTLGVLRGPAGVPQGYSLTVHCAPTDCGPKERH